MENFDTKIADIVSQFIDKPYAIDNKKEGFDCLNTLMTFYTSLGVKIPTEFEGWTLENYGKRALEDATFAHQMFEKYVKTLGEEISPHFKMRGDLLLFKVKDLGTYAGIYLGNGNVLLVFDKGVRVCPVAPFIEHIVSVRRLLKHDEAV